MSQYRGTMFTSVPIQLIVIFSLAGAYAEISPKPNRCEGLEDYLDELDCSFHPDDDLDVPQIIRRHGYPAESHTIQTDDGYLLTLHRIPGRRDGTTGGQAVLLQHGTFGSSADWILNGNDSLGFTLADQGYDVWLGNSRGNTYSRAHVSLPEWSKQFWNFSWHEMGVYDLPASLYHISNTTGKAGDIIYIGHSMGTTTFFVLSSTVPQAAKNVVLMIGLAPTAYLTHIRSPLRYLAPFANDVQWLAQHLGVKELLPYNKIFKLLSFECELKYVKKICENLVFLFSGIDDEFNSDLLPRILNHDPAGASTKTVIHYVQEIKNEGKFQQFDYGPQGNEIQYGTLTPPEYKLGVVKRPVYLIYAENDQVVHPVDVGRLIRKLTNLVGAYEVPRQDFGHVDFIFGKDAYDLVYKKVLEVMHNFTENSL